MTRPIAYLGFVPAIALSVAVALPSPAPAEDASAPSEKDRSRPNIIYILADDLGYGELGCYGQDKIRTPNIDQLAAEGMRFTQHYSGAPVCAPSRCTLLTGKHTGHAYIRANREMGGWGRGAREGQLHLPEGTATIASLLGDSGYATCAIGKWGLGGPGTSGQPNRQGFDHWYGYLCQRLAHNYYPEHLWRNQQKHILDGNDYFPAHQEMSSPPGDASEYEEYRGRQYAPDLMIDEALGFIGDNKDGPFFLYFATPVPHVALQVPEDSLVSYADQAWDDKPYLGQKGYLPHPAPRAAYAAMISRMDRDIGRIMSLLDELGLADNTLVMFSSDNGPTYAGGVDAEFFNSAGPLRGLKGSLYEGGIRVPMIVRWPDHVTPGRECDLLSAFWDIMPTLCEVVGIDAPDDVDGISLLGSLLNKSQGHRTRDFLYWEYRGGQAVRKGKWKALRRRGQDHPELYDLENDLGETTDVAGENPEIVEELERIMKSARTESVEFPLNKQ